MNRETFDTQIQTTAFDFFYWFSRFEFALKRNRYLKMVDIGRTAEPDWAAFAGAWCHGYALSAEARELVLAKPQRQILASPAGDLDWQEVGLHDCKDDLSKVVRVLSTVRNNLFHGGKHEVDGWDDRARTLKLLSLGLTVLDQLAALADIEADYRRQY